MAKRKKRRKSNGTTLRVTVDERGLVRSVTRVPKGSVITGDPFVTCSKCGKRIHRSDLRQHHQSAHKSSTENNQFSFLKKTSKKSRKRIRALRKISPAGTRLTNCPRCGVRVGKKNLKKQLRKVHGDISPRPAASPSIVNLPGVAVGKTMIQCPHCTSQVRSKNLKKHIFKVHSPKAPASNATTQEKPSRRIRKKIAGKRGRFHHSAKGAGDRTQLESLRQSHDEPYDGSKHWAHMRRERGRFGSHPLFDEYGEESEP
jgi:uncharacterized C2H2 Zn-finger protein